MCYDRATGPYPEPVPTVKIMNIIINNAWNELHEFLDCIYFRKPLLVSAVGLTTRCYLSASACSVN